MGGHVADYKIIADTTFRVTTVLSPNDPNPSNFTTFGFALPGDTIRNQPGIITFMLTESEGDNPRLTARINPDPTMPGGQSNVVFDRRIGPPTRDRFYQEVIPANILKKGDGNVMAFEVFDGTCRISDVVHWFQNAT